MRKTVLEVIVALLTMFLLVGCEKREKDVTITENITSKYKDIIEKSKDVFGNDYKVLLSNDIIINELNEEPIWSMANFGSIENFYNFCSTMSIPKEITDIYDEYKEKQALNENGELEFWRTSWEKDYLNSEPDFKVKEVEGKYYVTISDEADMNIKYQGFFRKGDNLVIISVIEYKETAKYLPERVKMLCRTEISSKDHATKYEKLDTALLDKRTFVPVMACPEFTVIYYTEINEFLCVKDSEAIGPPTVSQIDMEDVNFKGSGGFGTVNNFGVPNKKKMLIYPIVVKDSEGTSFNLRCISEMDDFKSQIGVPLWAQLKGSSIAYPVVDGNIFYSIDGATVADYEICYENNLERITPGKPLIVDSSKSIPRHHSIDYNDFKYELRDTSEEGYVHILMQNDDMQLSGEIKSQVNCIKNAIEEGKFSNYISEDKKCYQIPTYAEALQVLKDLGISVEIYAK